MTQKVQKWHKETANMVSKIYLFFITNFYDIQKVYKSDPIKSENGSNSKLTAWAACGFVENSSNSSFLI